MSSAQSITESDSSHQSATSEAEPWADTFPTTLPLANVHPASNQTHKKLPETEIGALAESICKNGLIIPLLLTPIAEGYKILDGERRFRAYIKLTLDHQ